MEVDYILVGQGLGGSILAYQLIEKGRRVVMIDTPEKNISSSVAAGLFNPITGRRSVKTWKAEIIFPYLDLFYKKVEKTLKIQFYNPKPMFRPFLNIEEENEINAKNNNHELGAYVNRIVQPGHDSRVINELGGVLLNHAGFLDIMKFISSVRSYINKKGVYYNENFDHDKLDTSNRKIIYRSIISKKIIFCEGSNVQRNPYFNWLPMRPVKGELMYINIEKPLDFIYNRKVFIIPFKDKLHKVGATYDWNNLDCETSLETKKYFEDKLKAILNVNFIIKRQLAGIRPATKDRRPFIGVHPENSQIGIFNGLGSKGVSLGPYYASQFIELLENDSEIDPEVNIKRYISLFS